MKTLFRCVLGLKNAVFYGKRFGDIKITPIFASWFFHNSIRFKVNRRSKAVGRQPEIAKSRPAFLREVGFLF